jgi:hypothetical protein
MICGDCGVVDIDSKGGRDFRAGIKWCRHATHLSIRVELVVKKTADILR